MILQTGNIVCIVEGCNRLIYSLAFETDMTYKTHCQRLMLRLFSRNVGEFYNGKETLPVFDWKPKEKTPIEIFHILMKPAEDLTTCKSVPSLISHNVCFLLDVRNLASKNDWKSDDMGSWKNNGVQYLHYHVGQDKDVILENDESREKAEKMFTMKRIYYKNNSSPDVKKIASFLEGMYYI